MRVYGNPIIIGEGGAELNITYGITPPEDTNKLWVPLESAPVDISCYYSQDTVTSLQKDKLFINLGGTSNKWQPVLGCNLYVNISSVQIGNENNVVENIDAYLYNTDSNEWVSLSGITYVAAKIKNTLYITQSYAAIKNENNLTIQ